LLARNSPVDAAERRSAARVKPASRAWFIVAGLGVGAIAAAVADARSPGARALMFAAAPLAGAAIGAWARRDRCSVCRAPLPLRVLDRACPACGNAIVTIVDGDRRVDLPAPAPGESIAGRSPGAAPYRAGSPAARDAAEEALDEASRTDVDARLKRLRQEPRIARALHDRDERELHRLVRARRQKSRSIAEEAALDALLADPRRQLAPSRRPWLGARAGCGLVLAGARDQDREDGSFIAEQLLVLGTYPVAPLGSYLARQRPDGGVDILGGLPMPGWKRLWRAAVVVPVVAATALAGHAWVASLSSKVHLLNGLDVPVLVTAGGETVRLAPGARVVHVLARGNQHLVAKDERGATLEEQDLDVPGGDALVVYDVVGAAPLVSREVFYTTSGRTPEDLQGEILVGRRVLIKANVEYAFVNAPRTIPGRADLRTWEVTERPGGWRGALEEDAWLPEKIALIEAVALAEPENEDAVNAAVAAIAQRDGTEIARAFIAKLSARAPGSAAVNVAAERLRRNPSTAP